MREFPFELAVCARLEADRQAVVARQLGGGVDRPGGRVLDVVVVEPGPAFDDRAAITPERIPGPAIESDVGPGRWRRPTDAFDAPPKRARQIAEWAVDVGFFEREYRSGRLHVRQVVRYPDWFGEIVAVENKPDLGDPGALERQLRTDVSLGLADRVVLATASHVTGVHLNRLPPEVGVWRFRPDPDVGDAATDTPEIDVVREATPLDSEAPGVELLDRHPAHDEIAVVDAEQKARARRRLAERAYGKGWRPDELPACRHACEGRVAGGGGTTFCQWKGRLVDPGAECGPSCSGHDPADPPRIDAETERARRTPWVVDPDGVDREQTGLDRFG